MDPNDMAFSALVHQAKLGDTRWEGLTKREWLAGTILAALAGGFGVATSEGRSDPAANSNPVVFAKDAILMADALIAELNK